MNKDLKEKFGFTLAEVLITLGIIGIVSAMTIPTLIKNYKEKVLVNKAKLAYSQIQNAIMLYIAQNNCPSSLCLFNTNHTSRKTRDEFATMLKGANLCTDYTKKICQSHSVKNGKPTKIDGEIAQSTETFPGGPNKIILPNGTAIAINQYNKCDDIWIKVIRDENGFATGETEELIANRCAHIYIDTNNMDPPNQFGRDVFRIPVLKSGQLDPKGGYMTGPLSKNKLEYEEY